MSQVRIRPARLEDVDQVAPLMYGSSAAMMDVTFGGHGVEPLDFVRFAYRGGKGFFGYERQLVAETATGEIVGTLTVYPGREFHQLSWQTLRAVLSFYGPWRAVAWLRRSLALADLFIRPSKEGLFL